MSLPRARADVLPEISIPRRVTGIGTLRRRDNSVPIAAFTVERPAYHTDQAWKFVAHAAEEHWSAWDAITDESGPPLVFEGRTDDGEDIQISEVHWNHQSQGRLEADVWQVRYSSSVAPASESEPPTRQYVIVRLTPTPLARSEVDVLSRSFTGELAPIPSSSEEPKKRLEPVLIPIAVGEARFSLTYSWEDVDLAGARCALRVPHPTLRFPIADETRRVDQFALMEEVDRAIEDALMVLSFLSRRFVRWTGIYCHSVWEGEDSRRRSEAAWERTIVGSTPRERRSPLVNGRRMGATAIADMVGRFAKLEAKQSIAAAMTYGIYVDDAPTLDSALTSAFTCFESLVSGVDTAYHGGKLLTDGQFRPVRRRVEALLTEIAAERQVGEETLAGMLKKIPELQRAPIVDRATALLERSKVKWVDLWPSGTELRPALSSAFKRRNRFLHGGVSPDPTLARADALRLRFLAERLLFSLLGGSEKWFDWRSFEEARWLATIAESAVPADSE